MFRLNPFVRVGLCLSAISCAWPVLAVDDDGETMVVTASSVEQNLKDAPASISVITQEDLQRKPVQNLGNDSNLLIVFYVQIMPDDFVMQLHR
ncbi:hypothetical protein MRY34_12625, partial [Escherichia coli]|nr:hypothetical protein [Escherichia coli]